MLRPEAEVLLYAPSGRNGEILELRLQGAGITCRLYETEDAFLAALQREADVLLLSQAAWTARVATGVKNFLEAQPPWSSPPLLILKDPRESEIIVGGAYVLEKPVPFATLLSTVRLALHARAKQLALGALINELEKRNLDLSGKVAVQTASLAASELRFEKAFRASPTPTVLVERRSGTLLDANPSFLALTEYTEEDLLGNTLENLKLIIGKWPWNKGFAGDIQGSDRFEIRLRTKSGHIRYCLFNADIISAEDSDSLLMTIVDISERKQNEKHLLHAIEEVMKDASWFSRAVVEKVGQLKGETFKRESSLELTRREEQVLGLIGQGLANKDIAARLELSPNTVRNYIKNLYGKIGVNSRTEAVIWARERGITFADT